MTSNVTDLNALTNFLADNEDLEALSERLTRFNLFNILKIEESELKHSNVLAWLLNPSGSHGLNSIFLKRFLTLFSQNHSTKGVTTAEIQLSTFEDVEVLREWEYIDILVVVHDHKGPGSTWCIAIENKIRAKEIKGQLKSAKEKVTNEWRDAIFVGMYLTKKGDDPSDDGVKEGYGNMSHEAVLELIENIYNRYHSRLKEFAAMFIHQYIMTMKNILKKDAETIRLAKKISQEHRHAVMLLMNTDTDNDLPDSKRGTAGKLVEVCSAIKSMHTAAVEQIMMSCEQSQVLATLKRHVGQFVTLADGCPPTIWNTNKLWFVPGGKFSKQKEILAEEKQWADFPKRLPIFCWYMTGRSSLQLTVMVGKMTNVDTRARMMDKIIDLGFSRGKNSLTQTRILSDQMDLHSKNGWEYDDKEILEVATKLWRRNKNKIDNLSELIATTDWDV